MLTSRRTRLSVLAAAASGALVLAMTGTALATDALDRAELDCSGVELPEEAQAVLDAVPSDLQKLDDAACGLLSSRDADEVADEPDSDGAPSTTPAAAPDDENGDDDKAEKKDGDDEDAADEDGAGGDRDCADFDTQAEAQAALEESSGDPERLDSDDDGIACEQQFGTEGRQVAVSPRGGVATGGAARP